ncbi:MAG TPA: electron transport complex subunit RsxC [Candidatus Limiplasma sp.]|nr:electron transport complex subunit RsxC [Candidatus Limiplasma sp.]HPS81331.1 electron transport complex subunit RsxC [Candidatus Limiplasma sp.]
MSLFHVFPGGIHPHEGLNGKSVTSRLPIVDAPLPSRVAIPLQQHIGAPCKCLVAKGDSVKAGMMIGEPVGFVSAAVHASISGTVVAVQPCIMPNGTLTPCVIIDNDGKDEWVEMKPVAEPDKLDGAALSQLARNAGLVGLGGATFPHAVKFAPPPGKTVDFLILNGAECEPYLSADHQLMLSQAAEIVAGAKTIQKTLNIPTVLIGIENNKKDAIRAISDACKAEPTFRVVPLPVHYPQGGEKQLLYALTGRIVPEGGLPLDRGAIVANVGSCYALYRAVYEGRPLVERVVTVSGCVKEPANYRVRIGAPVEWLLDTSGGMLPQAKVLLYGGPMMGVAINRVDIPITKGCSGITVLERTSAQDGESNCIRCGRCATVCPMKLVPATLDKLARKGMHEEAEKQGVLNCLECGACAWSCPAKRELTQSCRLSKKIIMERRRAEAAKKKEGK